MVDTLWYTLAKLLKINILEKKMHEKSFWVDLFTLMKQSTLITLCGQLCPHVVVHLSFVPVGAAVGWPLRGGWSV